MTYLDVAVLAARRAGEVIQRHAGARQQAETKSSPSDLVTVVDREAERAIRETILSAFPGHAILGEEEGGPDEATGPLWIVDPLDGTNNFVQTLPFYAVSIAFAIDGELRVGVIYDPSRNELFTAERGQGAFLNDEPIAVDPAPRLGEAMVATRTPFHHATGTVTNLDAYSRVAQRCRNMRNLGAAALEMAWVAAGRLTAFWEMELNAWDRGAGALLVAEAGGRVSTPAGQPLPLLPRCGVLATNGLIEAELLGALSE